MNDTRNRDKPASQLTKREEAALRLAERTAAFMPRGTKDEAFSAACVNLADALFDALDHLPELAHAYDEPDFDHEGTP